MSTTTCGLLISVRSVAEAETALAGGATLIDIKEPLHGALGAAAPETIANILSAVAGRAPVSAALGELIDWPTRAFAVDPQLAYAKFGLAGAAQHADWPARWRATLAGLPASIAPVAVAYADWRTAGAPGPEEVLQHAVALDCPALLIDTFDKSRGDLLVHWRLEELARFIAKAQAAKRLVVLGGSLSLAAIPRVRGLAVDYLAFRTAACAAGRQSTLDLACVRALQQALAPQPAESRPV